MAGKIKLIRSGAYGARGGTLHVPDDLTQGEAEGLVRVGKAQWCAPSAKPVKKISGKASHGS